MKELFVVIKRSTSGKVEIQRAADVTQAICMQASLLNNRPMEEVAAHISEQEIEAILNNLKEGMMDMAQSAEGDVTIVFLPPA